MNMSQDEMSVNMPQDEAQEALLAVKQVRDRANKIFSWWAIFEIIWGAIWVVCFLLSYFFSASWETLYGIWNIGFVSGLMIHSFVQGYLNRRIPMRVMSDHWLDSPSGSTATYIIAFILLANIIIQITQPQTFQQIILLFVVLNMFMYVIMGLRNKTLGDIGLGVVVTVLSLLGYYLLLRFYMLPSLFFLWEAAFAGGTMIVYGLLNLRPWRR